MTSPKNPSLVARWPLATAALLFLLWLAFELDYGSRAHRGIGPEPLPELWVFDGAHPKPWQFVTYAFVHGFRWHLRGNMLALTPAALLFEWRMGARRTVTLFFVLGVAVSMGFHLLDPRDLYGASGLVAGFISAAGTVWLLSKETRPWQRLLPALVACAYFAWSELWPAAHRHPTPGWKAHLVGALAGLAIAVLWCRRANVPANDSAGSSER